MSRSIDSATQNLTLDRYLNAGVQAVAEFGVDKVSVQFVSNLAEGSRPTFYSYFGDISGLLAEIWIAKSNTWLAQISDSKVGHSSWTKAQKTLNTAMTEILASSHRIPEINEVVQVGMQKWWQPFESQTDLDKLKLLWLFAERLGVTLTEPVDPGVHQAEFIEIALANLNSQLLPKKIKPLELPKLSDPVFEDESLDSKLLQSAIYIIANSGVKAASMARIARRTQVSTGALYPRFDNTNDIVEKSFELAISQVVNQNFAFAGTAGFSSEDFGSIIMAGLQDARRNWRNFRIEIHLGAKSRPSLSKRMKRNLRETNQVVALGLKPVANPELANGPVPYLMHAVGIGFAILQNAGLPVGELDHRNITIGLTRLINS